MRYASAVPRIVAIDHDESADGDADAVEASRKLREEARRVRDGLAPVVERLREIRRLREEHDRVVQPVPPPPDTSSEG